MELTRFRGDLKIGERTRKAVHVGKRKPPYPPAFRAEAVRLARSGQQPIAQIAIAVISVERIFVA